LTALVTGASRRIGRAIALACARNGHSVAVHHGRDADGAARTVTDIVALGRRAVAVGADLSDPEACVALVRAAERELGPLDLLVNNAAVFLRASETAGPADDLDRHMAVNARAVAVLCAEAGSGMRARGAGAIVNVTDVAGLTPWSAYPGYSASKAAAIALTRAFARSLAPQVRVNAVAPGPILPPATPGGEDRAQGEAAVRATLLGRYGSPEDVAEAVCFLAAAPYVTGLVLCVDGGRTLA